MSRILGSERPRREVCMVGLTGRDEHVTFRLQHRVGRHQFTLMGSSPWDMWGRYILADVSPGAHRAPKSLFLIRKTDKHCFKVLSLTLPPRTWLDHLSNSNPGKLFSRSIISDFNPASPLYTILRNPVSQADPDSALPTLSTLDQGSRRHRLVHL